jgi:uncharacterized Zn-finger protein
VDATEINEKIPLARSCGRMQQLKNLSNPNEPDTMATVCKHPRVRIVSRLEDTEFVECLECGEVFDYEEFRDMEIEETVATEEAETDS